MTMKVVSASEDDLLPTSALQIDRLGRTTARYKMEIGPDKTKVMTTQMASKERSR